MGSILIETVWAWESLRTKKRLKSSGEGRLAHPPERRMHYYFGTCAWGTGDGVKYHRFCLIIADVSPMCPVSSLRAQTGKNSQHFQNKM